MQLTFENNYVIAVVVFMLTMLFCKNMLECIQACIHVPGPVLLSFCAQRTRSAAPPIDAEGVPLVQCFPAPASASG